MRKKNPCFDWPRGTKHRARVKSAMQKTNKTAYLNKNLSPDTLKSGFNRLRSALRAMTVGALRQVYGRS